MSFWPLSSKRPSIALVVLLACLLAIVPGCGSAPRAATPREGLGGQDTAPNPAAAPAPAQPGTADAGAYGIDIDRKVAKNAEISVDVTDLTGAISKIEAAAEQVSGFLQDSSTTTNGDQRRSARVIVRVPSARFLEVVQLVESLGKVTKRRVFSEDVTEQYADLESRVTNLEEQQKRLREILAQAKNVDEILQVERELERVRLECDSLSGRLRLLKNRVEMSTINVYLRETPSAGQSVSTQPFGSAWSRAASAFVSNVNLLVEVGADLIVFLVGSLPTLVLLACLVAAALYIRRKWRSRGGRSA